ncbi:outer membrane protein assembly factor BamB family protein [Natrinema gari]|uniref:outer membrane protein assembly factor BamB family protein n=1 Tax=Natrinema gari TaxID=419186 RepID=UPI0006777DCD|nr:PQQ-binding-like beta-propeller repeat protein [Natrinema gari]
MDTPSRPCRRTVLAGVGTVLSAAAGCLGADRTPAASEIDWRMYGRDPGRTRYVPDADLPRDGVEVAWSRSVSASGWLPPVVANGTVYCQYANGLFVVDAETGDGDVSNTYGGFGRSAGPMAFASTTVYRDGVLLVPYGNVIGGYAAGPDSWPESVSGLGENLARWWINDEGVDVAPPGGFGADVTLSGTPVIADGAVVSLHSRGTVSAVTPDDGGERWRYGLAAANPDDEYSLVPIDHVVDTATGTVVVKGRVLGGPVLVGLDLANGTHEWTVGEGRTSEWRVEAGNSMAARDGTVYTVGWTESDSSRAVRIRELDAASGDRGWTRPLERDAHVGLAVDETTVYHVGVIEADEGADPIGVAAIDRADGGVRWTETIDDTPGSMLTEGGPPPTVAGDLLLVPGGAGLHALATADGERLWTFTETVGTSGGGETERAALTPAVVAGDRIVIGTTLMLYGLGDDGD